MLWEQKENYFYFIIMSTEHFSVLCLYQIMEILVINRKKYVQAFNSHFLISDI